MPSRLPLLPGSVKADLSCFSPSHADRASRRTADPERLGRVLTGNTQVGVNFRKNFCAKNGKILPAGVFLSRAS
jgi:hypothetical protein